MYPMVNRMCFVLKWLFWEPLRFPDIGITPLSVWYCWDNSCGLRLEFFSIYWPESCSGL